jgi:hypothetical protein
VPAASPPYQSHSPFTAPRCARVTKGPAIRQHNAIKIAVLETLVMTDKSNEVSEALLAHGQVEAGKECLGTELRLLLHTHIFLGL